MTVSLIDLDAMLHIISAVQWKAGNRDNKEAVKSHVRRFVSTIEKNSGCTHSLRFFQTIGHTNYRKTILPLYKSNRKTSEAVAHWKPTIVEAFSELKAIPLIHIESDDALNIVGREIGLDKITIVTSDKDMKQMACKQYDPFNSFKGKVHDERRWLDISSTYAYHFLYQQVLTGDPTDMPNELCGIQGVGEATAKKILAKYESEFYETAIKVAYSEKYGDEGFDRANLTYKMVKLLDGTESYLEEDAKKEISFLIDEYSYNLIPITNDITELFTKDSVDVSKLFNKK